MERTIQKAVVVPDGGWVTIDVYGDPGRPGLLVLPGVMSDAESWGPVARSIGAWASVTVVNRRGRPGSGPLPANYSVGTEVSDLLAVLRTIPEPDSLFGWSYGGLVALLAADRHPIGHLIAYEPVAPPFARDALPALQKADELGDRDSSVDIVNRRISGFTAEYVSALRADSDRWDILRTLSAPLYAELAALDAAVLPNMLANTVERIDLIIGQRNRSIEPYGVSFERIRDRIPHGCIHELAGNGHLAHVEAPVQLGRLIDETR